MVTLGFDIGKKSLVAVQTDNSHSLKKSYTLENTKERVGCFLDQMLEKHKSFRVISEATGEYHHDLALACLKRKVPFYLLNPITTKQFVKATVRKKKTDLSDAYIIAKLGLQKQGTLLTHEAFAREKPIIRTSVKLTSFHSSLTLMQKRFAEYYPQETELIEELNHCRDRIKKSIDIFRKRAEKYVDPKTRELLQTIPGIGPTLATSLVAEIGNIDRFKDGKSLVAYAGLDPGVKQSGTSLNRNGRLTKRGSPYLRRFAFIAASLAAIHDPELKSYFRAKRDEGKKYTEAVVTVSRKVLYRVYAVWKRQTPYVKVSS